jgi:hypothetical protein
MGRKDICEGSCGEVMKKEFKVGDIVKFYGKEIFKEKRWDEFLHEYFEGKRTKITKKDMIPPNFKIVIITKKANFDWNKHNNEIYVLEDKDRHIYINPYGQVLLQKASKKEIKKFTEKWVANKL